MLYFSIALISLMLGIYAGKRRAKGRRWCQITRELLFDICGTARSIWMHLTNLFRSEKDVADADGQLS